MAAETPVDDTTTDAPETAEPKSGKTSLIIVAVAALLGAGVGSFVVAPRVIAGSASPAPDSLEHGGSAAHDAGHALGGEIYTLDNIIVNPAGSEGQRFLMASVAFEVNTEEALEELRSQDVRLRDMVISTLEDLTMGMLTKRGARDSLKVILAEAVVPIVGKDVQVRVYLPRFVIQ